ncbi:MAG: hypothetical protein P9M15_05085, partial [Candidatus Electryoneaceae bacterium]|nr:hypothetical protein [Candidatus Electryoneaceae bacterium]
MVLKIIVITAFALIIVSLGILGMRKTRTFNDFFLGGGNIGPWMTAFTYGTAYFSAVLFIGFAGKIGWGFGYSSLWITVGNALLGVLGVWWLLGYRIKRMAVEYNVHTMAEYFNKRYDSKFLMFFSAVCIFIFFIPYSAAVFMGLSYLFEATFDIGYTYALVFMGIFTALYIVMGGYKSMTMIDVVFGIIMIVGVVILFGSVLDRGDGLANITATLSSIDPQLTGLVGPPGWWPLFCLVFLT